MASAGVRTGRLKASISTAQERAPLGQKLTLTADTPYATFHHEGTKPHVMTSAKGMVFMDTRKGRKVKVHVVNHPGNKANPFLAEQIKFLKT